MTWRLESRLLEDRDAKTAHARRPGSSGLRQRAMSRGHRRLLTIGERMCAREGASWVAEQTWVPEGTGQLVTINIRDTSTCATTGSGCHCRSSAIPLDFPCFMGLWRPARPLRNDFLIMKLLQQAIGRRVMRKDMFATHVQMFYLPLSRKRGYDLNELNACKSIRGWWTHGQSRWNVKRSKNETPQDRENLISARISDTYRSLSLNH